MYIPGVLLQSSRSPLPRSFGERKSIFYFQNFKSVHTHVDISHCRIFYKNLSILRLKNNFFMKEIVFLAVIDKMVCTFCVSWEVVHFILLVTHQEGTWGLHPLCHLQRGLHVGCSRRCLWTDSPASPAYWEKWYGKCLYTIEVLFQCIWSTWNHKKYTNYKYFIILLKYKYTFIFCFLIRSRCFLKWGTD